MATRPKASNAEAQRELWGRHPRDWAELQEGQLRSFYEAIVAGMAIGPETRLLRRRAAHWTDRSRSGIVKAIHNRRPS